MEKPNSYDSSTEQYIIDASNCAKGWQIRDMNSNEAVIDLLQQILDGQTRIISILSAFADKVNRDNRDDMF
jgi:hypothetical protein